MSDDTKLNKKQVVIKRTGRAGTSCFILSGPFEETSQQVHIDLCAKDFEAMGSPDQITITIEPGDRLNN